MLEERIARFALKTSKGISYREVGSGQALVLLHGIGSQSASWLNQLETLSFECDCRNPERLLELPALKWLTFCRSAIADDGLIATFKQRGIAVRVIG